MPVAQVKFPETVRVIFDGQSLNFTPLDWPVPKLFRIATGLPTYSVGKEGHGWYQLADGSGTVPAASERLHPYGRNRPGYTDLLIMNGGQGDYLNAAPGGQQTGDVVYDRAVDYANNARAAGLGPIIAVTNPPQGPFLDRPSPTEIAARLLYNELLRDDPENAFDAVVDWDVPPLNDSTDQIYFDIDNTHFRREGARVAVELLVPTVLSLIEE